MTPAAKYSGIVKLLVVLVVAPILVLGFSIKRNVALKISVAEQNEKIETIYKNNIPAGNIEEISIFGQWLKNGGLLNMVDPLADIYGITVESYTPYLTGSDGGAELYGGELILSGDFKSLVQFLDSIEKQPNNTNIISTGYLMHEMPQVQKKSLFMTIVFQEVCVISQTDKGDEK